MTDRSLAWLALIVAGVALAAGILHALTRDTANGGPAHARGFRTGTPLPRFDWNGASSSSSSSPSSSSSSSSSSLPSSSAPLEVSRRELAPLPAPPPPVDVLA